ncbi:MAG TPA: DNA polymerase III subunit gamma/tau [Flavobacterium sp.]
MSIPVVSPEIVEAPPKPEPELIPEPEIAEVVVAIEPIAQVTKGAPAVNVSALSIASIKAKRAILESNKLQVKEEVHLPTEPFTEIEMLEQWFKYAQRLSDKGHKIMESYLLINDPKLKGTTIIHELPNEGSKIDFESEKHNLLGYLRGKLHNHDITIDVIVNESIESKKAFSNQDRYNRLNEINPALEMLRNVFGLDIND